MNPPTESIFFMCTSVLNNVGALILTTGDETIAVAIENLEGQGVHCIRQTQQGFKGLELCEGNKAATDNQTVHLTSLRPSHRQASKTCVKQIRLEQLYQTVC